mmetsp:Transcript_132931/g.413302  ORF Transcript_132931/g.413302 Transcript_132931/m.413302 type:complete len:546 (+) Transcript_132931:89-1726(+)
MVLQVVGVERQPGLLHHHVLLEAGRPTHGGRQRRRPAAAVSETGPRGHPLGGALASVPEALAVAGEEAPGAGGGAAQLGQRIRHAHDHGDEAKGRDEAGAQQDKAIGPRPRSRLTPHHPRVDEEGENKVDGRLEQSADERDDGPEVVHRQRDNASAAYDDEVDRRADHVRTGGLLVQGLRADAGVEEADQDYKVGASAADDVQGQEEGDRPHERAEAEALDDGRRHGTPHEPVADARDEGVQADLRGPGDRERLQELAWLAHLCHELEVHPVSGVGKDHHRDGPERGLEVVRHRVPAGGGPAGRRAGGHVDARQGDDAQDRHKVDHVQEEGLVQVLQLHEREEDDDEEADPGHLAPMHGVEGAAQSVRHEVHEGAGACQLLGVEHVADHNLHRAGPTARDLCSVRERYCIRVECLHLHHDVGHQDVRKEADHQRHHSTQPAQRGKAARNGQNAHANDGRVDDPRRALPRDVALAHPVLRVRVLLRMKETLRAVQQAVADGAVAMLGARGSACDHKTCANTLSASRRSLVGGTGKDAPMGGWARPL